MRTLVIATAFAFLGCSNRGNDSTSSNLPPPPQRAPTGGATLAPPPVIKAPELSENDFVESDHNRDPFRPFSTTDKPGAKTTANQREIKLRQVGIDELRLIAIVLAGDGGRAMFVDPRGKGHILRRGEYLGRPDVVRVGNSGPEYQLNWRIDRIRDGDVVLIREDPAQPGVLPATRVIPLRPEGEQTIPLD